MVEVPSSRTIGNLITKLFHGVKIKPGRCKNNWAKYTQIYYGLSWCKEPCDNAIINFNNLAPFLPPDFFVISNTSTILLWDISPVILKMVTGLSWADPEFVVRGA